VVLEICRPGNMSARIICRPETGENMSAQKKIFQGRCPRTPAWGARPPAPPEGGPSGPPSYPPARPAQALKHYYSCKEYNTYPTPLVLLRLCSEAAVGFGHLFNQPLKGVNLCLEECIIMMKVCIYCLPFFQPLDKLMALFL
jgi:hypothetical protein